MANRCYLFLIFSFFLLSCQNKNTLFEDIERIDNNWKKNNAKSFSIPILNKDGKYDLQLIIRNNNQYPYRNLYIFTEIISPKGDSVIDTLEYQLADVTGKWLGSGMGEIKQNTLIFKENISLQDTGKYKVNISHAMRENNLKGLEDISLMVEKK